jgi:TATA-box binding protein (TBP) (component of TFIID and TFIIIB)
MNPSHSSFMNAIKERSESILRSKNNEPSILTHHISNLVCSVRLTTLNPIPGHSGSTPNIVPHSYSYPNRFPSNFIRLKDPPISISVFRSVLLQQEQEQEQESTQCYETSVLIVGAKDFYMIIYGIYHLYIHYRSSVTFVEITISIDNCVISGKILLPLNMNLIKSKTPSKDSNRFHPYQKSNPSNHSIEFKLGDTLSLRLFREHQIFNVMGIKWEDDTTIQSPCENAIQKIRDLFTPFVLSRR